MTLSVKAGQFAKRTSTGSQAITGLGFTPKLIIFEATDGETNATAETDYAKMVFGATSGPSNSECICLCVKATASGGSVGAIRTVRRSSAIVFNDQTALTDEAALTSFDADGFTLNWTTASSQAFLINYIAFGGSDLTNAIVTNGTKPTSTTNVAYTGFGFQPDIVLMAHPANGGNPLNTTSHATITLGAVDSGLTQWGHQIENKPVSTTSVTKIIRNSEIAVMLDNFDSSYKYRATVASLDADGFTLHPVTSEGTGATQIFIAIKCAKNKTGLLTKNATGSNNNQSVTGLGFRPKAVLLFDFGTTGDNLVQTGTGFTFGFSDGVGQYSAHFYTKDGQTGATTARSRTDNDRAAFITSAASDASTYTGTVASLDSGGFTMAWVTGAAYQSRIGYIALGDAQPIVEPVFGCVAG